MNFFHDEEYERKKQESKIRSLEYEVHRLQDESHYNEEYDDSYVLSRISDLEKQIETGENFQEELSELKKAVAKQQKIIDELVELHKIVVPPRERPFVGE